jgi:hypothetical protein
MNIKEAEIATIDAAIADKTDIFSVTTADIADRLKEIVDLLGAILVNPSLTYNIGLIVYTASPFAVYVCKVDGADGDVTNQTNWLKIAGSGLPYLVADTEVDIAIIVGSQAVPYYIPFPIVLSEKAGALFDLRISGRSATNSEPLAYAITISTTNCIEGSSIFIKTDTNTRGMHTLVVDGVHNERLQAGATYLFSKSTDVDVINGYVLIKIANGGMCTGMVTSLVVSTGKTLIGNQTCTLPLALGLLGEECEIITTVATAKTVLTSGSDTIVNTGSYTYDRPSLRFISDGVDKWYFV